MLAVAGDRVEVEEEGMSLTPSLSDRDSVGAEGGATTLRKAERVGTGDGEVPGGWTFEGGVELIWLGGEKVSSRRAR